MRKSIPFLVLVALTLITAACSKSATTPPATPTPAVAFWVEPQATAAADVSDSGGDVAATQAPVPVWTVTPAVPTAIPATAAPAPTATVDPDPLKTAYSAELTKLDSNEDLVQNGVNPSNPPQKYRLVFTGHGVFTYGNKTVNLPYHTPCDTAATSECRLYILVLQNLGTPGDAPINFLASNLPEGGTSSWEYRQGETPNLDPLWQLPLRDTNHCGYNCNQVVVVKMSGNSTASGDEITVSAMLYNRDGTNRDFTTELLVTSAGPTATPLP